MGGAVGLWEGLLVCRKSRWSVGGVIGLLEGLLVCWKGCWWVVGVRKGLMVCGRGPRETSMAMDGEWRL